MPRIKRVLEIGSGIGAQKAIATALDHPKVSVTAVELMPGNEHEVLLRRFGTARKNLRVERGKSVISHLLTTWKKEKQPVYDHAYAHWVLSNMPRQVRLNLFRELIKNLRPGAKWAIVDEGFIEAQIPEELTKAGFRVTVKRLGLNELIKDPPLNLEEVIANNPLRLMRIGSGTLANYGNMRRFLAELELLKRTKGEGEALKLLKTDRKLLRRRLESNEPRPPQGEDAEAIRKMVRRRGSDLQKPFVVITATKPR
jgi:phospholipid N-methyltransferase